MCGRFGLFASREALEAHFETDLASVDLRPRYNIAPSQALLVVDRSRSAASSFWGLVPPWSRDGKRRHPNARAESVADTPAFRAAFRDARLLVPASGYYEWESDREPAAASFTLRAPSARRPHWHAPPEGKPVAFAAIAAGWPQDDPDAASHCAILTTAARGPAAAVHDRMPLVVPPESFSHWLEDDAHAPERLEQLIAEAGELLWTTRLVSDAVNNPRNDGPELLRERI